MKLNFFNMYMIEKKKISQFFLLFLLILMNRLAIPGFTSLSVSMILIIFFIILSSAKNEVSIDKRNLIFYLIMLSFLFLSTVVSMFISVYTTTFLGVFLAFVIYTLILFDFKVKFAKDIVLNVFFIFILLGLFQYLIYQIFGNFWDLSSVVNSDFLVQGYNTSDGNEYMEKRTNGFVFLEPSFFSQFIALYIILEYSFFGFKRFLRVGIALIVLLLAASGTGPMLLIFYSIVHTVLKRNFKMLSLFLTIALLLPILFKLGLTFVPDFMGYLLERLGEFSLGGDNSFNYRFILPYSSAYEFLSNSNYLTFLFGNGPLTTAEINTRNWNSDANFSTLLVSIFEYGLFFTLFYIFYLYRISSKVFYKDLQLSVLFMFFVLSGAFYQNYTIILLWILCKVIDFNNKVG